jgi:hypothetical protein
MLGEVQAQESSLNICPIMIFSAVKLHLYHLILHHFLLKITQAFSSTYQQLISSISTILLISTTIVKSTILNSIFLSLILQFLIFFI